MHAEVHRLKDAFDTSLQKKDPLASLLVAFLSDTATTSRAKKREAVNNIAKTLLTEWAPVVQCWLDKAFPSTVRMDGDKLVVNELTCNIFFQFQWELFTSSEEKARDYLLCIHKNNYWASPTFTIPQISLAGGSRKNSCPSNENGPFKKKKRDLVTDVQTPSDQATDSVSFCTSKETMETNQQLAMDNALTINPEYAAPPVNPIPMENVSGIDPLPYPSAADIIMPDVVNDEPQRSISNAYAFEDEVQHNWLCEPEQRHSDLEEEDTQAIFNMPDGYNDSDAGLLNDRPKPPLPVYPPIWAQSRQEVCESFGWFRSYQGGVYFTRDVVKGYLLGGFSASRDRFEHEGKLIISHGGGKAACTLHQSRQILMTAEDDQLAQDKSVRALLRTYKESRPLVLVIDERYALFPFDLSSKGVAYAVLGFYTIAHAWAEYQPASNDQGQVIRYKFAFRWCEGQGQPWWIQGPSTDMPANVMVLPTARVPSRRSPVKMSERPLVDINPSIPTHLYSTCVRCRESSPMVYIQSWACLNPECLLFWTTRQNHKLPDRLDYNPRFLELTQPLFLTGSFVAGLKPSLPQSAPGNGHITTYAFTRGWHCDHCGRLSCRFKWEMYECAHCQSSLSISGQIRSSNTLRALHVPVPFQDYNYSAASKITFAGVRYTNLEEGYGSFCHTFKLPFGRGLIHHIKACTPDAQPLADQVFNLYQEQALTGLLPFRRWPLRSHRCRGPLLTNYFSQNCGVPYQYVGGTANTLSWDKAPHAVVRARDLIELQVSKALERSVEFNEVLSAAYMERQRMAFHSDSEPGLGPLVAGLSLGSPALMHFRLLAKYEPIQEQRQIAITFVLRHGDILAMDGSKIQKYYEHTVIPSNFRIAATARFIDKGHASAEAVQHC